MGEVLETMPKSSTGLFFDSRCQLHQANFRHPEGPARLLKSYTKLVNSGLWNRGLHLQLEGSGILDSFDDADRKLVYGSTVSGLADKKYENSDPEVQQAGLAEDVPQFTTALKVDLSIAPSFHALTTEPLPLLEVKDILRVHDTRHVEDLLEQADADHGPDELDSETEADDTLYPGCTFAKADLFLNRFSAVAAKTAVSGTAHLAALVAAGACRNAFALVRPPGHHAAPSTADGFCLFNNVAVAAAHVRASSPNVRKVLIVDFDVHHGDGTQACFYSDPDTLFVSIHQFGKSFFPGTGLSEELGEGAGRGFTVNVPATVSAGDYEYLYAWARLVLPVAAAFSPDMIFISAGFDCLKGDPLGAMVLSPNGLFYLTRSLMDSAVCPSGRVIAALEGGYNPDVVADGVCAVVSALMGDEVPLLSNPTESFDSRDLQRHFAKVRPFYAAVEHCRKLLSEFWPAVTPAKLSKGEPAFPSYDTVCCETMQIMKSRYMTGSVFAGEGKALLPEEEDKNQDQEVQGVEELLKRLAL